MEGIIKYMENKDISLPFNMSDEQKRAVMFGKGVMELIAGPGSGKTFVLTNRIRMLIEVYGIRPESILVITFTRAAAVEMSTRFYRLMGGERPPVVFGTFHSVFYQILRTSPDMKKCTLISEHEKMNVITEMLRQAEAANVAEDIDQVAAVAGAVSRIKNDGILPWNDDGENRQYSEISDMLPGDKLRKVYDGYNAYLYDNAKLDFDDMILRCRMKLECDLNLLKSWQNRFEYILIDEFQDICLLQYQVIKLLAAPQDNIFAVGDDDQSIYGFRGARPDIMKTLVYDYRSAERLTLSTNYRSSSVIAESAGIVISENKDRIAKDIKASHAGGVPVRFISCKSRDEILRSLTDVLRKEDTDKCAVLCRKNRECHEMAEYLIRNGIDVQIRERIRGTIDDAMVNDMMNYLEFIYGQRSRNILFKIMNRPVRYIKRDSVSSEAAEMSDIVRNYDGNPRMQESIRRFFGDMDKMKKMRPFLAVNYIRKVEGYDKWSYEGLTSEQKMDYIKRADAFQQKAKELGSFDRIKEYMDLCRKNAEKKADSTDGKGVKVMTYHGSKGLEFDSVFLPFLNEGEIPPKQSNTIEAIEEERRMFYVALTRAENRLTMLYAESSQDTPSRFISRMIPHT